ncbi:MAG: integration host factor subunit beta [Planctomycetes bacterium]|nr:integration host factor subunit beta [Planctomycetota bacterium]
MGTVTRKDLIAQVAESTQARRGVVRPVVQCFLDEIVGELAKGNRLEFRGFGVFETRVWAARIAQNMHGQEPVHVPAKQTVKFKMGRQMKQKLNGNGVKIEE